MHCNNHWTETTFVAISLLPCIVWSIHHYRYIPDGTTNCLQTFSLASLCEVVPLTLTTTTGAYSSTCHHLAIAENYLLKECLGTSPFGKKSSGITVSKGHVVHKILHTLYINSSRLAYRDMLTTLTCTCTLID